MDALREGLLRAADDISLAFQNAGQSFGFLADGRSLIETSRDDAGDSVATLPSLSDEGWPEVRVPLPTNANFHSAATGPLSRVARWTVERPARDVLEELSARADSAPFESRADGRAVASLGSRARLSVKAASPGMTLLSVKQVREPDAIREVLRGRAARWTKSDLR